MSESPPGAAPLKPLDVAYRELLESLWYASEVFKNEGDGGLEGAKLACHAVARFLWVRNENPELAAPFLTLFTSFRDLEQGVEPPLFSNSPRLKERDRSSQRKHLQMLAAVALEVLMKTGVLLEEAGREVAPAVNGWPGFRAQKVTWETVRNWRDQIRSSEDPRNQQFQRHCQSKLVYFAKTSEPDFAAIDFPAFLRVDLSGSMAAPSI